MPLARRQKYSAQMCQVDCSLQRVSFSKRNYKCTDLTILITTIQRFYKERNLIFFRGFYNIEDSPAQTFDEAMLSVLVNLLPSIVEVHWAGSLRWLQLLITRFLPLDRNHSIAQKCISLVQQIAAEISNRVNPYHLLLATR